MCQAWGKGHTLDRSDKVLPSWCLQSWGEGTNIDRANKDINKIISVRRVGKKINQMMKEKVIGGGQLP